MTTIESSSIYPNGGYSFTPIIAGGLAVCVGVALTALGASSQFGKALDVTRFSLIASGSGLLILSPFILTFALSKKNKLSILIPNENEEISQSEKTHFSKIPLENFIPIIEENPHMLAKLWNAQVITAENIANVLSPKMGVAIEMLCDNIYGETTDWRNIIRAILFSQNKHKTEPLARIYVTFEDREIKESSPKIACFNEQLAAYIEVEGKDKATPLVKELSARITALFKEKSRPHWSNHEEVFAHMVANS